MRHETPLRGFGRSVRRAAGFTLIELLVSFTIIGLLSTAGLVAYSTVRSRARDAKRVGDVRQIQTAIEIFYESNSFYPSDLNRGVAGLVIGEDPRAENLSDAGFSVSPTGLLYMAKLPSNPLPYGAPYVYRSLNGDGTDCDRDRCESFVLLFWLERGQGDYAVGPHSLSPIGTVPDDKGYDGQDVVIGGSPPGVDIEATFDRYASETVRVVGEVRSDETVQQVTEKAVAPTVGVMAVVNTVAATGTQLYHLFFFILQPLQLAKRRKNQAWGIVYNSLSHLPEDLAIVRLHDSITKRIVKSQVTDIKGRFSFLVGPGSYVISVAKVGYQFPSGLVRDTEADGAYENVYTGDIISVHGDGTVVTPNIPIDPPEAPETAAAVRKSQSKIRWQKNLAVLAFGLGIIAFAMTPTTLTGLLLTAQVVVYMLFKRLAETKEPKNWGVVYDVATEDPVPRAIVRIFEGKYNKLLESQITDRRGRYHFRVGQNVYYITVTKPGYLKTETNKLDLNAQEGATVIASDLPLKRDPNYRGVEPTEDRPRPQPGKLVPPGGKRTSGTFGIENGLPVQKSSFLRPQANGAVKPQVVKDDGVSSQTVSIDLILPQMAKAAAESEAESRLPKTESTEAVAPAAKSEPLPEPSVTELENKAPDVAPGKTPDKPAGSDESGKPEPPPKDAKKAWFRD